MIKIIKINLVVMISGFWEVRGSEILWSFFLLEKPPLQSKFFPAKKQKKNLAGKTLLWKGTRSALFYGFFGKYSRISQRLNERICNHGESKFN
jgi:hypothetical protein